jgi:transposase
VLSRRAIPLAIGRPDGVLSVLPHTRGYMGWQREYTWILGLEGFRVEVITWNKDGTRVLIRIERQSIRGYECSGCRRRTWRVRDRVERTWDDLRWAEHHVTLVYQQRRIYCRTCGIRTERVAFADPKARITRRLRQLIGLDCQSMPTSHAAVRHGVSWNKARRAEKVFLREWDDARPKRRPRHLGADEIHRGKAQKFYTVLSDLVHGAVIGLSPDRTDASLTGLLSTCLDARQRAAVDAVCTDMHQPYLKAVGAVLKNAEIVFDKFHVLQHASAALDEVRRQDAVMRTCGRGKPGSSCAAGRQCGDRSGTSCSSCSPPIVASSKRTSSASNSIGCGPAQPARASLSFSSAGWSPTLATTARDGEAR